MDTRHGTQETTALEGPTIGAQLLRYIFRSAFRKESIYTILVNCPAIGGTVSQYSIYTFEVSTH